MKRNSGLAGSSPHSRPSVKTSGRRGNAVAAAAGALALTVWGIGVISGEHDKDPSRTAPNSGIADIFRSVLPHQLISRDVRVDSTTVPGSAAPVARLLYRDAHGSSQLEAALSRLPKGSPPEVRACPNRANFPFDRCHSRTLPNGSQLTVDQGFANPARPLGVKVWYAMLTTKDGHQVVISARNAPSNQATSPTRDQPPLTTGQLSAAVLSPRWSTALAGLPTPPTPPPPPLDPELSRPQMLRILKSLLPKGLRVGDEAGATKGYIDVTVDDGRGKALVNVNVQRWKPGVPQLDELFEGARAVGNGALLQTRKVPAVDGTGATSWEADVLYKDRWRVYITEYNSSAYGIPITRHDLPLTMPQLSAIALAADWHG